MEPSPHHGEGRPSLTRRSALRLLGGGVIAAGLAFAWPNPAIAAPSASQETLDKLSDAQSRYDAAQRSLAQIGQELEELTYQRDETQGKIDELTQRISAKQQEIDAKQASIQSTQGDITAKQGDITARQQEMDAKRRQLAERVSDDYKSGSVSLLSVILNSKTMESLLSNVRYMDSISRSQAEHIAEVKDLKAQLEQQKAELEQQKQALEDQKAQLEQQRSELVGERTELQGQQDDLKSLQATLEQQVAAAEAKEREATDLVSSLDQEVKDLMRKKADEEEAARQEEIRKAQEAAAAAASARAQAKSGSAAAAGVPAVVGDDLRSRLVSAALSLLGTPYVWGGTWPTSGGTDCSGLMQWAFKQCGYSIPRTTYTQLPACRAAGHLFYDTSQLQPGDLVFCNGGHHVVMYIGNGNVVHDPHPGDVVRVAPLSQFSIVAMGFPV